MTARTVPESAGNIFIPVTLRQPDLRQPISETVTVSIVVVDGSATERSGITVTLWHLQIMDMLGSAILLFTERLSSRKCSY